MKATDISGFLCGTKIRKDFVFMAGIGIPLLLLINVAFLYAALNAAPEDHIAVTCMSLFFIVFTVYVFYSGYQTYCLLSIGYSSTGKKLIIKDKKKNYTIDLSKNFFITTIKIRFYHGKSSELVSFFLLSTSPIDSTHGNYESLNAIRIILKSSAFILPVEDETTQWIKHVSNLDSILEYPKVMYYPSELK